MARGRLISKSLGSSRKFHDLLRLGGKLGEFCQVLFPLLIANTDDFGRLPGDAFTVKNVVLPSSKRTEADFERALQIIASAQLAERYVAEGAIYLQINKFDEHQPNLQKRTTSRFPECSGHSGISQNVPLNLIECKRTESNPEVNPELRLERREADRLFAHFWASYPKKKAKEAAQKAWSKRSPDPELLSVMLSALERQKVSPDWQKDRGRYIPHPATWLNDARWTDVVEVDLAEGLVISDQTRSNLQAREQAMAKLKKASQV